MEKMGHAEVCLQVMFYKWVPYLQRYLFNANPDTNHNANSTNPKGNSKR